MTKDTVHKLAYTTATQVAPKYGADPKWMASYLTGIAQKESSFRPDVTNKRSTSRGLMQMLICTQREVEKKRAKVVFASAMYSCKMYPTVRMPKIMDRMFDPEYSMLLAAHYLGYQFKRYGGDWTKAVHAYNQGSYPGTHKSDGEKYSKYVLKNMPDPKVYLFGNKLSTTSKPPLNKCLVFDEILLCGVTRSEFY